MTWSVSSRPGFYSEAHIGLPNHSLNLSTDFNVLYTLPRFNVFDIAGLRGSSRLLAMRMQRRPERRGPAIATYVILDRRDMRRLNSYVQ